MLLLSIKFELGSCCKCWWSQSSRLHDFQTLPTCHHTLPWHDSDYNKMHALMCAECVELSWVSTAGETLNWSNLTKSNFLTWWIQGRLFIVLQLSSSHHQTSLISDFLFIFIRATTTNNSSMISLADNTKISKNENKFYLLDS